MAEAKPYPGPSAPPFRVLYIGGTGRTGSTLLTRLLGEFDGWFAGGELAFLWRHGLAGGGRCSCGEPIVACGLWREVLGRAGVDPAVDGPRMTELRRRFWSVHLPLMVSRAETERRLDRLEDFPELVERLYRSIAEVTGATVLVDSSKEPHYGFILRERTGLDVRFLHLVRDPRAVGFSWERRRDEVGLPGAATLEQRGPARASAYYDVSNLAAEALWRDRPEEYSFLRYEELVADPAAAVARIGDFVGSPVDAGRVLSAGPGETSRFEVTAGHMAWGNPNRFAAGPETIGADDAWRTELSAARSRSLSYLAGGVGRRYGYRSSGGGQLEAPTSPLPRARNLLPAEAEAPPEGFVELAPELDGIEGWLRPGQAERLWRAAAAVPSGGRIVEIGSYHGKSTIVLARAAEVGVEIVAIDPHAGNDRGPGEWSGSAEAGEADHQRFLANLERHGVADRVRHVREFSQTAHDRVESGIDFLYIDGAHGYAPARSDIVQWGAKVRPGGTMAIHDVFTSVFVTLAVVRTLFPSGDWRYLGRERSMAIYRKEPLDGPSERIANIGRQSASLPFFARAVAIKALRRAGVENAARVVGHEPGTGVY